MKSNDTIEISKVNESYLKINCENRGILKEISEYFTFYVPDHKYHPLYKAKKWTGTIKLFSLITHLLPYGLLSKLEIFAKDRNYDVLLDSNVNYTNNIKQSILDSTHYIKTLNLSDKTGKPMVIRDYQIESFNEINNKKRILLLSPTSSGKSLILYTSVRKILEDNPKYKGLLVVPTLMLVGQMSGDFSDYSKINKWSTKNKIQEIYQGKSKEIKKSLTISTWQSLLNEPRSFFEQFDFLIIDEAHLGTSKSISHIVTNCINASYKIGTTGTLSGTKVSELFLNGLFGDTFNIVTTKQLMDNDHISKLKIKCILFKYDSKHKFKPVSRASYDDEINYIVSSASRNEIIKNLVLSMKGNTLILFRYVEKHGKILKELISKEIGKTRKLFYLDGNTPPEERERIRQQIELETDCIILGSSSLISTGTNIVNLHNLVFAHPYKGRIRNLQSIGRGLRKGKNKQLATLYDIGDDFCYNQPNYSLLHLKERVRMYREEKFELKIFKLNLPVFNKKE